MKNAHHRAAAAIKIDREGHERTFVFVHSLCHPVIHAAQRVRFVIDYALDLVFYNMHLRGRSWPAGRIRS
jgi:hypothetical protein